MKQVRKISILIFFFSLYTKSLLFSQNTVSQKELIASFENLISNSKKLQKQNLPDSAIQLLIKAKSVAKQLNDKAKIAQAHLALADRYYWGISDYYKCRKELDTLGNKYYDILTQNQKCKYLSQYGDAIYYDLEYVRSVEYYFKALEHVGTDSVMLARLYHNIGWVYTDLKKYDKGIEFGLKALEVAQKGHGDLTHKLEGLVYIYKTAKQYGKALEYQDKLALIDTSKEQTTFNYYQRLGIYVEMQKYDSALYYGAKALELAHEIKQTRTVMMILDDLLSACLKGDRMTNFKKYLTEYEELAIKYNKPYDVDMVYSLAGEYYLKRNDFAASKHYLDKAKQLQEQFKRENIEHTYFSLSQWYAINNDYKNAYHFLDKYTNISDSLHLLERYDATKALDNYLKIYSMENTLSKHRIELENQSLQLENEKSQKYMMLIGLVCILLLALFFLKNILDRKKMNKILVDKNKTIEIKNELLSTKNKEILDSISYAKRLQEAILPPQKLVLKHLENSFILYKPKDIVAGDFYWMETKNDLVLFAAADCTGHGVPGAMVSVVCSNALNRAVKEFDITQPGKILDKVRDLVVETFEKSENEVKDGMDISLCAFNLKLKKLYWSGANNPLWLVRGNELIDYAPDKQPIGKTEKSVLFSTKEIDLKAGDSFYIFTDGYCDQFGGEKGKKFKTANFKKLILSVQKHNMSAQREELNKVFQEWKGDLEQVDDVCVIGVRV